MTERLKDKVSLASGVASGIGQISALTCAGEGTKVVIADINVEITLTMADNYRRILQKAGGQIILGEKLRSNQLSEAALNRAGRFKSKWSTKRCTSKKW